MVYIGDSNIKKLAGFFQNYCIDGDNNATYM